MTGESGDGKALEGGSSAPASGSTHPHQGEALPAHGEFPGFVYRGKWVNEMTREEAVKALNEMIRQHMPKVIRREYHPK